jgi:hypothetical protein
MFLTTVSFRVLEPKNHAPIDRWMLKRLGSRYSPESYFYVIPPRRSDGAKDGTSMSTKSVESFSDFFSDGTSMVVGVIESNSSSEMD